MSKLVSIIDRYPDFRVNIGMEVHVQLSTQSKIFCASENGPSKNPNQNIDVICAGYPGSLPMFNRQVVHNAILLGLATNCTINRYSEFARKHYFYPDLPKGYQITQDDKPLCSEGFVEIRLENGSKKKIRIKRIHLEEDAGKNIHTAQSEVSLVDLNRAGSPLLEIVSYPDISNSVEARAYLKTLHAIVTTLNISTGNMEEGAFRADTNVSVRLATKEELGTRCELKNINSFKFIFDATEYEIERHIKLVQKGERIIQETRLWDTKEQKTFGMRSKEEAADYRYFPDPDLPPVFVDDEWIERVKRKLPELPMQKSERFQKEYGLKADDADIISEDGALAQFYEKAAKVYFSPTLVNWVVRDLIGYLNDRKLTVSESLVSPESLAQLVKLLDTNKINNRAAREIFEILTEKSGNPELIMRERGLEQMEDSAALEAIIVQIITENSNQVAAFKAGKTKLWGFFVGEAMARTKGRGNPQLIQTLLKKHLG